MNEASTCYPEAAELRAAIARHRLQRYRVAAAARMSPTSLYEALAGRRCLDRDRALRIQEAIARLAAEAVP